MEHGWFFSLFSYHTFISHVLLLTMANSFISFIVYSCVDKGLLYHFVVFHQVVNWCFWTHPLLIPNSLQNLNGKNSLGTWYFNYTIHHELVEKDILIQNKLPLFSGHWQAEAWSMETSMSAIFTLSNICNYWSLQMHIWWHLQEMVEE